MRGCWKIWTVSNGRCYRRQTPWGSHRATRKNMVFWHLLMSWSPQVSYQPEGRRSKRESGEKKESRWKKRTPCCFSLMWRQTEKLEHGMRFYIHLANIVWNSDWHYSNFSTWNPSGALHPVFVQQNYKELLRGCKMSKDRYRGLNSTVETSLENRYFCRHISNDNA